VPWSVAEGCIEAKRPLEVSLMLAEAAWFDDSVEKRLAGGNPQLVGGRSRLQIDTIVGTPRTSSGFRCFAVRIRPAARRFSTRSSIGFSAGDEKLLNRRLRNETMGERLQNSCYCKVRYGLAHRLGSFQHDHVASTFYQNQLGTGNVVAQVD